MRRISVLLLSACAALAASAALLTTSAFGAPESLPKLGRCVAMSGGEFSTKNCQSRVAPGKGKFKWLEAEKKKFALEMEGIKAGAPLELETADTKHLIRCQVGVNPEGAPGEYTGFQSAKVPLLLVGCALKATHQNCTNSPNPTQETEIELTAEGALGVITGGTKPVIGWDLKGISTTITCGKLPEKVVTDKLEGSAIAPVKPLSVMVSEFGLLYKASAGKQIPESFEGAPKDVLMSTFELTGSPEATGLQARVKITNEEPLEIKVKCLEGTKACK